MKNKYQNELDDREYRIALAWMALEQREAKKQPDKPNLRYPVIFILALLVYAVVLLWLAFG